MIRSTPRIAIIFLLAGLCLACHVPCSASGSSVVQCKMQPDGQSVEIEPAVVTAVFPDCYYVEQPNRVCGIRVQTPGSSLQVGGWVSVSGDMGTTADRERCITNPTSTPHPELTGTVSPLRLNTRDIGGRDWRYQSGTGAGQIGVSGSSSLNNIGLLVRVYGAVKDIQAGSFSIDDGSGTVKVIAPGGVTVSPSWKHAIVTGICSCVPAASGVLPVVLVRDASDIVSEDGNLTAVAIARPAHVAPGQAVMFDGLLSTCSASDGIAGYEWDFDYDGHTFNVDATGPTPSFAYTSFGPRTVALRVTVNGVFPSSAIATTPVFVDAGNLPPVADPGGPYIEGESESVTFDGGASYDPNASAGDSIVSYSWDLNGDGVYGDATGAAPTLTWAQLSPMGPYWGTRNIRLRVTDALGGMSDSGTTLSRYPNDPVAAFTASSSAVAVGQPVALDGSESYHPRPDRQIVNYEWDFDYDLVSFQTEDTGVAVTFVPPTMGTYNIALRVTDNSTPPRTSIVTKAITATIVNHAPVAAPGGPYAINQGEGLTLYAGQSYEPDAAAGDSIVSYEWDINNDGSYEYYGTSPLRALTWANLQSYGLSLGVYTIRLRVTDSLGGSCVAYGRLTIYANQPTARFTVTPGHG